MRLARSIDPKVTCLPEEPSEKDGIVDKKEERWFEFGGNRAMIVDVAGGFYALKKTLRSDIGFIEKDLMFRAGMEGAREYLSGMDAGLKNREPREAIEMMLEQYSLRGYGDFTLKRVDAQRMVIEVSSSNTVEAWAFQANKDLQREGVCSYLSGVLTMIAKIAFGEPAGRDSDMSAIETECVAQGKKECRFTVAPLSELPKLVPTYELPRESASEHVLRLNEEILLKNLELQSFNLSLERQMRKKSEDLRRSEDNYKLLIDLSPDPIIICTAEGGVYSANEAGLRMLGYESSKEVEGMNFESILAGGKLGWEKLTWQLEKEGTVKNLETELLRKDGNKIAVEISARHAVLLPGRCVEAIFRDVSEKKTMQAKVVEAEFETEFLNDLLSHDITNFTVSALYFLNNLRRSSNLTDEERQTLMTAIKDMQGAFELSSSVRDLNRLKTINDEVVEVKELQTLVAEGIEEAKRMYSEKKIRVNFERSSDPRFIRGNALCPRVFTNLLTNAIKFDKNPETIIDINIENEARNGIAFWRVNISDRGPGIPDTEKEKIFERFYRMDSSVPGTGLGLFVVRFIVKACGGEVWAENRVQGDPSKGARMVVLLQKASERQVAAMSRR
jgi:PAS domain S-box-containing protein